MTVCILFLCHVAVLPDEDHVNVFISLITYLEAKIQCANNLLYFLIIWKRMTSLIVH